MDSRSGRKRDYRRREDTNRNNSESPPSSPRVVILRPSGNVRIASPPAPSATSAAVSSPTIVQIIQSQAHPPALNLEESIQEMVTSMPPSMKIVDGDSWAFQEHPAIDHLFSDQICAGGFTVVSAIGGPSVGKSSLLNRIAGSTAFRTHADNGPDDILLKHVTQGVDLHVTDERLLLLDTQPLLSASVLDDFIKNPAASNNLSSEIAEPECFAYITSLQLIAFLLSVSDYLIVVTDWSLDLHLIKLIETGIMMVGNNSRRAELIWHHPKSGSDDGLRHKKITSALESFLGREYLKVMEEGSDFDLLSAVSRVSSRRTAAADGSTDNNRSSSTGPTSERSWLVGAQRFWDSSIRKSSLYSDYARFMP